MDDKRVIEKFWVAFLVGLISVVGILLLLSQGASAKPMLQGTEADLAIAKSASPESAIAGEPLTYTLTIINGGPLSATDIIVTDALPPGVTFDPASPGCDHSGGIVTCTLDALDASETATFTIVVAVHASTTGTITNSATVTATTVDTDTLDNTAEIGTNVSAEADLAASKTGTPDPVTAGTPLTYTLTATNHGPSDATGVTVTDTLPSGVAFGSASSGCGHSGGTVTCNAGALALDHTATFTIIVTPAASGTITNIVQVSGSEPDGNPGNNTYTGTTTVNPGVDLAIAKADSSDPVIAGTPLTYTLTVVNYGPSNATGVSVADTLPSGVIFASATASQGDYNSSTGVWAVGSLANSASATLTMSVSVNPSTRGTITNTAQVSASETDIAPANNSDAESTVVNAAADLEIAKQDSPDPVTAGTPLTYTLTATNHGPSDATGVTVTDTLPSGVAFGSASSGCGHSGGTVTCNAGALALDHTATFTIIVTPAASGTITNIVQVSGSEPDGNPGNNTYTGTTTINPGVDLAVAKADSPDPVIAGAPLTYTLTVVNYGPSNATNVSVADTLPSGVTFGSATASQGSYNSGTGVWNVGSLATSASATLTMSVSANPSTRGTITNTAQASASETDIAPANNSDAESTVVNAAADLEIAKQDSPDPVVAGTPLTYTLTVTNHGPSDATGVIVTDTLPSGVTFVSATPSQGAYNSGTGVWSVGNLLRNSIATLAIRTTVRSSTTGTIYSYATVSGNEDDPISTNNTALEDTQVNVEVNLAITKSAPATVDAGAPLTYTITITNSGPSDATGVVVTDTLDPNVTYTTASPPPDFSNGNLYWTPTRLEPNTSQQITLGVQVHTPLTNNITLTNTARLDSDQTIPVSVTRSTTVHSSPVLTITKTDYPDPVNAGDPLRYTIAITNSGNENATSVTVTEQYDPNVSFFSADPPPDPGTENRVWTFPTLNVDAPRTIDIFVQVASPLPVGTVLTDHATLDSDQTPPITATEATSVTSASELTVSKVDSSDPIQAGAYLLYFISYNNSGTAPATGVIITETYDSQVTFVSANPAPKPGTNNVWEIGSLAVDQGGSIVVTSRVATPLANGTILTNRVTIDSLYTAPRTFTETTIVSSAPDLTLNVTDYPDPVAAGAPLTYTLRYTNTGNADATSAVITTTFGSYVSFSSATPPPSGGGGQVRYWNVDTIPGEGGQGQIVIRTDVTTPLTNGTQLQFQAQLGYAEGGPAVATAQTRVTSAPALSFTKSNGTDIVYAGDLLTYTLNYTNSGNENASNVTITDTLPDFVTYVGCEIVGGDCEPIPPIQPDYVVFHVPVVTLAGGQALLIVRVVDPLPAGANAVVNRASMAHASLPVPINVSDEDVIGTLPDLVITAEHTPILFIPAELMTYTVTYGNAGQHIDTEDVIITTIIPTNTVYIGYGWYSSDGRTYTYAAGDLPAGSTGHVVTFTVLNTETPDCPENGVREFHTPFTIADQGGAGRDASPSDNTTDAFVGVPDLVVTNFTVAPLPPRPGQPLTFTVTVKNQGTGIARNPSPTGGPFWMDVFTASVRSCPWERYSESDIFLGVPPLLPGEEYTLAFTDGRFTEAQIHTIDAFYVKVDNYHTNPYGLVPEYNEMNNVAGPVNPWQHYIYLPLTAKRMGD